MARFWRWLAVFAWRRWGSAVAGDASGVECPECGRYRLSLLEARLEIQDLRDESIMHGCQVRCGIVTDLRISLHNARRELANARKVMDRIRRKAL